jgi:hypothetical protein
MNIRFFLFALLFAVASACSSSGEQGNGAKTGASAVAVDKGEPKADGPDAVPAEELPPPPPILQDLGVKMVTSASKRSKVESGWFYAAINAAREGDYATLQTHVLADKGLFFIDRPGIAQDIHLLDKAEGLAKTSWDAFRKGNTSRIDKRPVFPVKPFKVSPEWLEQNPKDFPALRCAVEGEFKYLPDLLTSLGEYGFLSLNEAKEAKAREIAALVQLEVLVDWVYYYFGEVDGKWRLLGVDIARCDFSA